MEAEQKSCQNCKADFTIEPADFDFYKKIDVPPPTWCPDCRLVRRLIFRNERTLYKRKCDLCGEAKIMQYPEDAPFPVYCRSCWWSDKWSADKYARDWDPGRSFWEQFRDLMHAVPRPGTVNQGNIVNSDYTNRATDLRNCYLVFGTTVAEDSRYSTQINDSKNCADCYNAKRSEGCYECIDCHQCYNTAYSQESSECTDSYFLYNCRNLQNCFGCVNLRNKQYCIWNEQYTKEDYQKTIAGYQLGNALMLQGLRTKFEDFKKSFIVPWMVSHHNQGVSGNWIESSKDLYHSFGCENIEEGKFAMGVFATKDAMDHSFWGNGSERIYEAVNVGIQCGDIRFSSECWNQTIGAELCMNCHNSRNLFGCVGIRNGEYRILNKQYSEEGFKDLTARIRKEMDDKPYSDPKGRTYRYGEFFPPELLSPHAYNESIAQEFFPLSKEQAEERGYPWREEQGRDYKITLDVSRIPDDIAATEDSVLQEVVGCAHGGRCNQKCTTAFRIIPEEMQFYRAHGIPLPKLCPNCRHFERLARRNPLKMWHRNCQCAGAASEGGTYKNTASAHAKHGPEEHCPNEFQTSYAPDRPEIVYCEQCYQAEVA